MVLKWMSSGILRLPRSTQLLLDFARYCEIKQDCPHRSGDALICYHGCSGGKECRFENCPRMKRGIN